MSQAFSGVEPDVVSVTLPIGKLLSQPARKSFSRRRYFSDTFQLQFFEVAMLRYMSLAVLGCLLVGGGVEAQFNPRQKAQGGQFGRNQGQGQQGQRQMGGNSGIREIGGVGNNPNIRPISGRLGYLGGAGQGLVNNPFQNGSNRNNNNPLQNNGNNNSFQNNNWGNNWQNGNWNNGWGSNWNNGWGNDWNNGWGNNWNNGWNNGWGNNWGNNGGNFFGNGFPQNAFGNPFGFNNNNLFQPGFGLGNFGFGRGF